jgi:hypothetical protein
MKPEYKTDMYLSGTSGSDEKNTYSGCEPYLGGKGPL